ncbi:MAG: ADP-ribosylglycohydrolase family protein [Desulfovibrionaceae bacterium]|nr:ADP-ribosylglycohydrolase family protein [Desulfovibrionaceae bacterium]
MPTTFDAHPVACETCLFRSTTLEDGTFLDRANTGTCQIYEDMKPHEVYWDGAPCESYEKSDDRPLSLMVGLAVGDALGVPVEFKPRGSFHVTGMQGNGTHNQPAGTWSDDTSLALALADGILPNSLGLESIAYNFKQWYDKGAYTPYGKVFDVGGATARAIARLKKGVPPTEAGGKDGRDNGNGSLMRIAPLTFYMFGIRDPKERYSIVKDVSSITHAHETSVTACFIYVEMLNWIRMNRAKDVAYAKVKEYFQKYFPFINDELKARFSRILQGDIRDLAEADIRSSGYVVDTLEAAFWSFLTTDNYRDAVLKAVNLGVDTDTVGAVTGAMAGLAYGLDAIPKEWRRQLAAYDEIRRITVAMPRWDHFRSAS